MTPDLPRVRTVPFEARHARWLVETKLDPSVSGVSEHSGIMRIMELCLCYDRLEGAGLACMELLAGRAQGQGVAQAIQGHQRWPLVPRNIRDTGFLDGVSSP